MARASTNKKIATAGRKPKAWWIDSKVTIPLVISLAFGLVFGVPVFIPKVSVDFEKILEADGGEPVFLITNQGQFGLNDVTVSCSIQSLTYASPNIHISENYIWVRTSIGRLEPAARTQAVCLLKLFATITGQLPTGGKITVIVGFRPDYWPWPVFRPQDFLSKGDIKAWYPPRLF